MKKLAAGLIAISLTACASTPGMTSQNDPYEEFNRDMLAFNLAVDDHILEPVSEGYVAVTPQYGRDRVSDFFGNLGEPITFVNNVLQGEGGDAFETGLRFVVNSTVGIVGLYDITGQNGLDRKSEDFGQTLAVWGVDSGPYLVMPILGPTNPRDLVGTGVNNAANPTNFVNYSTDDENEVPIRVGLGVVNGINQRANAQDAIDSLKTQADPYIALRRIHTLQRDAAIRNGQPNPDADEELPDFDDF